MRDACKARVSRLASFFSFSSQSRFEAFCCKDSALSAENGNGFEKGVCFEHGLGMIVQPQIVKTQSGCTLFLLHA